MSEIMRFRGMHCMRCSKLNELAKMSMVGSGVSVLEDHTQVLKERIVDLAAKEEELMANVEGAFELYNQLCDRLDQVRCAGPVDFSPAQRQNSSRLLVSHANVCRHSASYQASPNV